MKKRTCGLLLGLLCTTALTGCAPEEKAEPENTEVQKVQDRYLCGKDW